MNRCGVIIAAVLWVIPCKGRSQEVIAGSKFDAFIASPGEYLEMPVILKDTYEGISSAFSRIETQNNYTADMYVRFKLGRSPYPCIGLNTGLLSSGLDKCAPGDLVRVEGNLAQIWQSRTMATVQGQYSGGPSYDESINVYGPLASEYIFLVTQIQKGWGKQESTGEMLSEGKRLPDAVYHDVPLADLNLEPGRLAEKCIFFQGGFGGLVSSFSDLEKAAGFSPDKVIKFAVQGEAMGNYVPLSAASMEGFRSIPLGNKIKVYGRIRVKETPQGVLAGVMVDRVTKTVRVSAPAAAPAQKAPSQSGGAGGLIELVPPPAP